MYDDHEHIARVHVYDKCVEIDISWSEVGALLDGGEMIEAHAFNELMERRSELLTEWVRASTWCRSFTAYRPTELVARCSETAALLVSWSTSPRPCRNRPDRLTPSRHGRSRGPAGRRSRPGTRRTCAARPATAARAGSTACSR